MALRAVRTTRRRLALGLAALPILAACGPAVPQSGSPAPAATQPPASAATPAEPKPAQPTTAAAVPAKSDAAQAKSDAVPQSGNPAPAKAAEPAKAAAPVTLTWDTFRGVGTPYPDELIKAFRAKQPNITIEFRPLPTSQT